MDSGTKTLSVMLHYFCIFIISLYMYDPFIFFFDTIFCFTVDTHTPFNFVGFLRNVSMSDIKENISEQPVAIELQGKYADLLVNIVY